VLHMAVGWTSQERGRRVLRRHWWCGVVAEAEAGPLLEDSGAVVSGGEVREDNSAASSKCHGRK
jgi:hypothetical protein